MLTTSPVDGLSRNLRIDVFPPAILVNDAIRLRCTIPTSAENRQLSYGIEGYTQSDRQLDGERSPRVFEVTIGHIPCDAGPAFCVVVSATGEIGRVAQELVVGGCSVTGDHEP